MSVQERYFRGEGNDHRCAHVCTFLYYFSFRVVLCFGCDLIVLRLRWFRRSLFVLVRRCLTAAEAYLRKALHDKPTLSEARNLRTFPSRLVPFPAIRRLGIDDM